MMIQIMNWSFFEVVLLKKDINITDIIGKRYGKLVVSEYVGILPYGHKGKKRSHYKCLCDCGGNRIVMRNDLTRNRTRSCGNCNIQSIVQEKDYYRCFTKNGASFIFDAVDLELVKKHIWWISLSDGYAITWIKGKNVRLTHLQQTIPDEKYVDHINGDRTDNRRSNLRIVTQKQNNQNKAIRRTNTTGFVGIYYHRKNHNYVASLSHDGIKEHLGCYKTAEEAASAYDEAARFYFGEFACLNFPLPGEQGCRRNQTA